MGTFYIFATNYFSMKQKTVLKTLSCALFLINFLALHGQIRTCGTMEYLEQQKLDDPKLEFRMERIERLTREIAQRPSKAVVGIITIPVVVHVVYNNDTENISDAQIFSQIAILNEDFRRLNSDADNQWPQAADVEIEFCLASLDPDGNPTTGITRTFTNSPSFGSNNFVKFDLTGGKNAWDSDHYLNIWVCDLNDILGYAQFPGGSASTDGIVCHYLAFGNTGTATPPFDLGRTATHEVGHWLNLRHIWGDGDCSTDDFVADTPESDGPNFGCAYDHVSCGSLDMIKNYMDYSDDACLTLFTEGQKERMLALFEPGGDREDLLTSPACQLTNYCQGDDLTLEQNLTAGEFEFWAASTITAKDFVLPNVTAEYYAGTSITFLPGTEFRAGSNVIAAIEDCLPTTAPESETLIPDVEEQSLKDFTTKVDQRVHHLKAYPNPTNGQLTIEYHLPVAGAVSLHLIDVLGRPVKTLKNSESHPTGDHRFLLSTTDLHTGTYFVVLKSGDTHESRRIVVLR